MTLDPTSIDAMHWAQQLVATAKKHNFPLEKVLDEEWLVGWFANYWAAVNDPLQMQNEQLQEQLQLKELELDGIGSKLLNLQQAYIQLQKERNLFREVLDTINEQIKIVHLDMGGKHRYAIAQKDQQVIGETLQNIKELYDLHPERT